MGKVKIYAVKKGRNTGLFTTWEECKAQTEGFPGAIFKSFPTVQEAQDWLFGKDEMISLFDEDFVLKNVPLKKKKKNPAPALSLSSPDFIIYTDGSCLRNPDGPGGYAAVILDAAGHPVREIHGGEPSTTNNRMELRAGIEALNSLPLHSVVDFYTDSQYMKNAFTKYWLKNWKRRGWLTSTGEPVKNQDLWRALDEAYHNHTVQFHWVKGHAGNRWNERCDTLARNEAIKFSR